MYEIFEHTADVGIRVCAPELDTLFADAAAGLLSLLVANPDAIQPVQEKAYSLPGGQLDYLLFDWLSELLYTFDTEQFLFACCDVRVNERGLEAVCRGEPADRQRHHLEHEVKAATYHGLKVERQEDGWLAEVIVDI
jgi:SHS2 domain-containing protein